MRGRFFLVGFAALWLSVVVLAQQAQELYQRGLSQEHASGRLDEAIVLYRQAAQAAGSDRALAARALMRAAGAYEKLGRQGDAATMYAEVVRMYPEQRVEVGLAQERLTALRRRAPADTANVRGGGLTNVSAVTPFVDRYCSRCHNASNRSGGLDFTSLDQRDVGRNTTQWEQVVRRLVARHDPPPGAPRPDDAAYRAVISRLQQSLDAAYATNHTLSGASRVDDAELAARLAKLVWNAGPDASLLEDARAGRLHEAAVLNRQVARLLRDSKSAALVSGFFTEWLSLDRIRRLQPDVVRFPGVDAELIAAMDSETRLFIEEQLREDHDPLELWTANYTYVNARLARHYGLADISGPDFRRITWPDGRRAGLLGQAGILAVWSMPGRTSPVQRGRFVLSRFLGVEAPSPPANVPAMAERPPSAATMRDRMRIHKINPSCANCHALFDPIGFALENFDAMGEWRTTDGGAPIDASGTFADGARFNGPAELRTRLTVYREAYYLSLTQHLLAYALNRGKAGQVYDYEMPTVRAIVRRAADTGYGWSTIFAGIAASTPFQMKNVVP
jgi:hypothetical protein